MYIFLHFTIFLLQKSCRAVKKVCPFKSGLFREIPELHQHFERGRSRHVCQPRDRGRQPLQQRPQLWRLKQRQQGGLQEDSHQDLENTLLLQVMTLTKEATLERAVFMSAADVKMEIPVMYEKTQVFVSRLMLRWTYQFSCDP